MWNLFEQLDLRAAAWVCLHRTPAATVLMRLLTTIGSPAVMTLLGVIAVGVLYWRGRRHHAFTVASGLIGSWLLNELLKRLFHRLRPAGAWLTTASGYSFPSGHAMVSISFFIVLAVTLSSGVRSPRQRALILAGGVLGSLLVGISRVYLGVHYATDVIAGFGIGAAWGALVLIAFGRRARARV